MLKNISVEESDPTDSKAYDSEDHFHSRIIALGIGHSTYEVIGIFFSSGVMWAELRQVLKAVLNALTSLYGAEHAFVLINNGGKLKRQSIEALLNTLGRRVTARKDAKAAKGKWYRVCKVGSKTRAFVPVQAIQRVFENSALCVRNFINIIAV